MKTIKIISLWMVLIFLSLPLLAAEIKIVTEYIYPTEYTVTPITTTLPNGQVIISGGIVIPGGFKTREVGVDMVVEASVGNLNATVSLIPSMNHNNQLIMASTLGDIKKVKENISKYDVNAKNSYGSTAIMGACSVGSEIIVKMLIEKGADINVFNEYGLNPLMCAVKNNHKNVVKILLGKNAKDIKNKDGVSAMDLALKNGNEEIIAMLK